MLEKKQRLLMAGLNDELKLGFGLCLSVLTVGDGRLAMAGPISGAYVFGTFCASRETKLRASVRLAFFRVSWALSMRLSPFFFLFFFFFFIKIK